MREDNAKKQVIKIALFAHVNTVLYTCIAKSDALSLN